MVLAFLLSGSALAARIHVSVTGPHKPRANQIIVLSMSGYTRRPYTSLLLLFDNRPCATTAIAESGRTGNERRYRPITGRFRVRQMIRTVRGPHYACVYLVRNGPPYDTKARASAHYATR
jgi:hypothetical protein